MNVLDIRLVLTLLAELLVIGRFAERLGALLDAPEAARLGWRRGA